MTNEITKKTLENMIYEIRGKQVMLDSDLARLYETETKRINEAVRNNPRKFPERFAFKISEDEYKILKSEISTSNLNNHGGSRKGHTVFTEEGVAMLATILHTKVAVEISINIMDAFVKMRHFINDSLIEQKYINTMVLDHDNKINELFDRFDKKDNHLFLENTIFDSYIDVLSVLKQAKKELIIIDNYADINTLNLIKKLNIKVTIISNNKKYLTKEEISKYNQEYNNLNVIFNNSFHDRYIILDNKDIFLLGSSINNIGSKVSSIIKNNDIDINNILLDKIDKIL